MWISQAARQGVAVLMVTVQVALKGVYSTPSKTNSFDLNDFKFGLIDKVPGYTNPTKFGLDWSSGGAPTWWWNIQVLWLLLFLLFLLFFFSGSRPVETREPILTHDSSKDAVWHKEVPFGGEKYNFWKFGGVLPQKHPKNGSE